MKKPASRKKPSNQIGDITASDQAQVNIAGGDIHQTIQLPPSPPSAYAAGWIAGWIC